MGKSIWRQESEWDTWFRRIVTTLVAFVIAIMIFIILSQWSETYRSIMAIWSSMCVDWLERVMAWEMVGIVEFIVGGFIIFFLMLLPLWLLWPIGYLILWFIFWTMGRYYERRRY